jgi:hypothetical protein
VQQSNATLWDYNGVWNPRTGSDGQGYNSISAGTIFSAGAPGANDVLVTADPFFDKSRNIATWDAALGGPGTTANALAEMGKRNDPTGYNTAYSIEALVDWVRDGFRVTDASLNNAGHDGVTIGAMGYVASGVTGTVTSATGGVGVAVVGAGATAPFVPTAQRRLYTAELSVYDETLPGLRTLYFASELGFVSKPTDAPSNTEFAARIKQPAFPPAGCVLPRDNGRAWRVRDRGLDPEQQGTGRSTTCSTMASTGGMRCSGSGMKSPRTPRRIPSC